MESAALALPKSLETMSLGTKYYNILHFIPLFKPSCLKMARISFHSGRHLLKYLGNLRENPKSPICNVIPQMWLVESIGNLCKTIRIEQRQKTWQQQWVQLDNKEKSNHFKWQPRYLWGGVLTRLNWWYLGSFPSSRWVILRTNECQNHMLSVTFKKMVGISW